MHSSHFLDINLTTQPERFSEVSTDLPLLNSDHDIVYNTLHLQPVRPHPVRLERSFLHANYNLMTQILSQCQWQIIFSDYVTINDY